MMKRFKQHLMESGGVNHPPYKPERNLRKVIAKYKIPDKHGYGEVYYSDNRIVIPLSEMPLSALDDKNFKPEPYHPGVQKLIKDLESGRFKDPRMTSFSIQEGSFGTKVNKVSMDFANLLITKNPKKLFHWTETKNVKKILEQGLIPTGGDWQIAGGSASYKAVFMAQKSSALTKNYGFKHYKKPKFTLLEIDPQGLKLYVDPAYFNPDPISYISFETVPASQVKVK